MKVTNSILTRFTESSVFIVGVVAKKKAVPPVTQDSSVVILVEPQNPNQVQQIVQIAKRSNKFFLRVAQGSAAEEAARSLQQTDSKSVQKLADYIIEPDYEGQQEEFCSEVNAKIQYPKFAHPKLLVALRESLLNNELQVQVQAKAQYAHSCKTEDLKLHEINLTGQLQRGPNMTEWARTKSIEAQKCQQDENQGFSSSDNCLTVANQQASALNRAQLFIRVCTGTHAD